MTHPHDAPHPYAGPPQPPAPNKMSSGNKSMLIVAAVLALIVLGTIVNAVTDTDETQPADAAPAVTEPVGTTGGDTGGDTAELPDLVGEVLQDAQDAAQANGFYDLDSTDASGLDRFSVLDRNWQVCAQTPEPGQHPTSTTVTFDVVKLEETCP